MSKLGRLLLSLSVGLIGVGAASCGDSAPSLVEGPSKLPSRDLLQAVTGPLTCTPLPADSVTKVIGPGGGTINVGPHSFAIPAGALDSAVSITAVTPSDAVNRIVFQPSGLVFRQPATLTMSYANCGVLGSLLPTQIAYIDNLLEILYYLPSIDNVQSQTVTAQVQHFSDYAVAW
jgi:hypothetical protein